MVPNIRPAAAPLVTTGAALFPLLLLSCMVLSSATDTLPSFVKSPQNQTGVSGGVASFVCQATGQPKPRITWMKNGEEVGFSRKEVIEFDGGAGSVLRIEPLRMQQNEAIYECTAINSVGQISTSAKLTVIKEDQIPDGFPTINMDPQLRVVEKTRATIMACAASGSPDVKITWFKDMLPVDIDGSNGRIKQLHAEATGFLQIGDSRESDEGKYECVATNSAGTRYSSPANLYVRVRRAPPRFVIPPMDQEVSPGENVSLTCVAEGMPVPYVKWSMGTEELTKEDEIPLERNVLEVTNIRESANYTCVAESSLGRIEATAQVTVKGFPSFVKSLVDQTGISGGVASFVCQATGEPKPRITWRKKGRKVNSQRFEVKEFDDGSGFILRIQPLHTRRDEGIYECMATNSAGQINSNAKLTVLEEHQIPHGFPTIDMGPELLVVQKNQTAVMVCTASGIPDPEISWYKDMLPVDINSSTRRIKQLHSGALQIENSEESDQGKYECVATNRAGTRYSAPANLYVRERRPVRNVPPRFSIRPTNQEVMPGESVNLTCEAVGSPKPNVKWIIREEDLTMETRTSLGRNVLEMTNIRESANYTCLAASLLGFIVATARVTVKSLPKPLTSFTVAETTATSVTLTWDSGNTEPVSYMIQYRAKASDDSFQRVEGVATTRYTIEGLRPYSEYQFRVMPMNSVGLGAPSDVVETRTGEQAPSSPPLHVHVHMLSGSTMLVQWEPPEEPNGLIIGYRVYYNKDQTAPLSAWQKHNTDDSSLAAISGLIPNTTYSLRVLGFTSVGDGPLSDMLQVNLQQRELPKPLTSFSVTETTATSVTLSWDSGNTAPLSYIIQYRAKASDDSFQQVEGVATARYTIRDLRSYSEYQFRVMAVNNIGRGPPSSIVETRTGEQAPSSPPLNVQARMLSANAVLVQWEPPEDPNGLIIGYRVYYSKNVTAPLSAWQKRNIADGRVTAISGLIPNTAYGLRVLGFTSVGDGPLSDILQVNVQQRELPKPLTSLNVTETTATSVTLAWDSGNTAPLSYIIQYRAKANNSFQQVEGVATTRYTIRGLRPYSEYQFRVMAVNNIGRGPPSSIVETRTGEQAPSSPPLNVQARMLSANSMLVHWEPPEDPNGLIIGYRVYYSKDLTAPLSAWQQINIAGSRVITITAMIPNTGYSLRVLGFTSVGDGPLSDILQVNVQQRVSAQPSSFDAEAEQDDRIMLTWLWPVPDHITQYELVYWEAGSDTKIIKVFEPTNSYAVDGLKPDTLYRFVLAGRSEFGLRNLTQTIEARTAQSMPAAPPRRLEVEALNSTAIRVTWKPPLHQKQKGQIRGYQVIFSRLENGEPRGLPSIMDIALPQAQEAIIDGLHSETSYAVAVAAYTTEGDGARSKAKVITTTGAVPGKPHMMIIIVNNNVVIEWQPPKEMVGPLIGYQLQYKRTDDENFTSQEISLPLLHQYRVAGLHKGTTYIFRLSARNRAGIGEACIKEISTPEEIPSGFPINLQVTGVTQSSMQLTWEPPLLAERNGKIISYAVRYRGIKDQQITTYTTTEPYLTIQDLNPDTTYDIRVQAQTRKGSGPLSPSIHSRTLASP